MRMDLYYIDESFEKNFEVFVDLYGIDQGKVVKILNHSAKRSRRLDCHRKGECEPFTVLHLGFIDFAKYFVVVRFADLESIHETYHIQDVLFYVSDQSLKWSYEDEH
jgi:hypothetical protein